MPSSQARSQIDQMPSSQKFSQNFHLKVFSNSLRVLDACLEMSSDSKNYVDFLSDEISELGHTGLSVCS